MLFRFENYELGYAKVRIKDMRTASMKEYADEHLEKMNYG
jgi:hypothetical protein